MRHVASCVAGTAWKNVSRVDVRTLGVFRVLLASVVLWELASNWPDACDFYSDDGLIVSTTLQLWPNLHQLYGSCAWTTFLYIIHIAMACLLALGVHPNLCCLGCWILYCSLASRNPFVQCGGDALLRSEPISSGNTGAHGLPGASRFEGLDGSKPAM